MNIDDIKLSHPDSNFFIPIDLSLDPQEAKTFIESDLYKRHFEKVKDTNVLHFINQINSWFSISMSNINKTLNPIKLKLGACNVFLTDNNAKPRGIHIDTVPTNDGFKILEGRLSFYEYSDAPGTLSWWDDKLEMLFEEGEWYSNGKNMGYRNLYRSKLMIDGVSWKEIPDPVYSTTTNVSSAFVRTNDPHIITQGNGKRIAITFTITKLDGDSTGVWKIIRDNFTT